MINHAMVWPTMTGYLTALVWAMIIVIAFYGISLLADHCLLRLETRVKHSPVFFDLCRRSLRVGLMTIGIISALGTCGVNVAALITSLGLVGFAVGFALKDMLANFIAGVILIINRPFSPGQVISIDKATGIVTSITLRYTTITEKDSPRITFIPNAKLLNELVSVDASTDPMQTTSTANTQLPDESAKIAASNENASRVLKK